MKIRIETLDVWRLDSSRKLVVCANSASTMFSLVSLGTGQSTDPMTGKELFDYLVYGKNPLSNGDRSGTGRLPIFVKELSLRRKLEQEIPNFGPYASRFVWEEDVSDPEILKYHT